MTNESLASEQFAFSSDVMTSASQPRLTSVPRRGSFWAAGDDRAPSWNWAAAATPQPAPAKQQIKAPSALQSAARSHPLLALQSTVRQARMVQEQGGSCWRPFRASTKGRSQDAAFSPPSLDPRSLLSLAHDGIAGLALRLIQLSGPDPSSSPGQLLCLRISSSLSTLPAREPALQALPFASVTDGSVHPGPGGLGTPAPAPALAAISHADGHLRGDGVTVTATTSSAAVAAAAAAKAEVGRATWTLLHTLAAQFPDRPSRQQQRDARTLVDCLTRIYPCGDCAAHFAELVRRDPPAVSSGPAFRRWLCSVHNRVNARLGKPAFNCDLVESRWAPLGCSSEEAAAGEPPRAGCELRGVGAGGGGGGGAGRGGLWRG